MDYSTFDPLAEAVRYGHRIGLQIHAWVTINEDDHGWGLKSQFSQQLFWEADYIADRANAAELKQLMARRALSAPV
jgi:hypothetical protein